MALARLQALRSPTLKHAAFLMGLSTTGTKAELVTSILQATEERPHHVHKRNRIASVDMGIRNLAYCVVDPISSHGEPSPSAPTTSKQPTTLHIRHWQRLDLLDPTSFATQDVSSPNPASSPSAAFTPSALSSTALKICTQLLSHEPTTILIERQRFRSGGAAAIQEWTVRVNMLESMLWACLRTLEAMPQQGHKKRGEEGSEFPRVYEVPPKRVAGFWAASETAFGRQVRERMFEDRNAEEEKRNEVVRRGREKVSKADKIGIVKRWVGASLDGDGHVGDVRLEFEGQAAETVNSFQRLRKVRRRDESEQVTSAASKLDDLADCLLQAAAWARWQENRESIAKLLRDDM